MHCSPRLLLLASLLLFGLAACDDIGLIYDRDPNDGPNAGQDGDATGIEVVATGGRSVSKRPRLLGAFPEGSGWPTTVPVVLAFNESLAPSSVAPSQGSPRVSIRVAGSADTGGVDLSQGVPSDIVYLMGDSVLVLRPLRGLTPDTEFEVVIDGELSDADGVTFGSEAEVVATFRTDQSEDVEDGDLVALLPLDRSRDVTREAPVWAIFSRAPNRPSITDENFALRSSGGVVAGGIDAPVDDVEGEDDLRLLRFRPAVPFDALTDFEVALSDTITFGAEGVLSVSGTEILQSFRTVSPTAPTGLRIGNAPAGFENAVSQANITNLLVDVDIDAGVKAGDQVVVRIYGGDPGTDAAGDLDFIELAAAVDVDGPGTVTLSFAERLGTPAELRFEEGELALLARVDGSGGSSGYVTIPDAARRPLLDVTPPEILSFAPTLDDGVNTIVTDQQQLVVYGTADEPLGGGSLAVNGQTVSLFGSDTAGGFVFEPALLGRLTGPVDFVMNVSDAAGNASTVAVEGTVRQRGVVTGAFAGQLQVEAYDETTFELVSGATVLIEPGQPVVPVDPARQVGTTGVDGRVSFDSLPAGPYTVTIVADGYDLVTLCETAAAFCSLPLRPTTGDTAQLLGKVLVPPDSGRSVLVGSNAFDDVATETVQSTLTTWTDFGPVAVRPNRPQVVTAFGGSFEPVSVPSYRYFACLMCGVDGITRSAPLAPIQPGDTANLTMPGLDAEGDPINLASGYVLDFGTVAGLGALQAAPSVRVMGSLNGFGGMTPIGVGFSASLGGSSYRVDASYSRAMLDSFEPYASAYWVSTTASDGANLVRHRRIILDPSSGVTAQTTAVPGVPTLEASAAPFDGAPVLSYSDRFDRSILLANSFTVTTLIATDSAGRAWRLIRNDTDGAGSVYAQQFPSLDGVATGLAAGAWQVTAENSGSYIPGSGDHDLVIEEWRRAQVTFARAAAITVTVQ